LVQNLRRYKKAIKKRLNPNMENALGKAGSLWKNVTKKATTPQKQRTRETLE
jgi:hypothetical protein